MTTFTKEQLIERVKAVIHLAAIHPKSHTARLDAEINKIALAALGTDTRENPVLAYADRYRSMAMQGVESIPIWSVITDLERNIAPLYTSTPAPVEQSPEIIDYEHRMICGELRSVPKFSVEETHLNMLKEELDVNAKLAEYSLNKSQPQPTPESEDRRMLKRLAVIISGNDAPGEIRSLTVTAQSLVDRCKTLARDKEVLLSDPHMLWRAASPDEINKRSIRESTNIDSPSREAIVAGGVLVQCPRCHGDSYRLNFNGWAYFWCDKCASAITSEGK
ncbi:hypothetical protein [Citrobacter freundii]|uniref:hypothetical protein n=1 Tax=Citrobacter freundii TaxID=546 RepID=UPI0008FD4609|nr:hypothetical protein [Citrobacter freundii]OIY13568.1 hypothetical protein BED44_17810 [Citrobacter freundii]